MPGQRAFPRARALVRRLLLRAVAVVPQRGVDDRRPDVDEPPVTAAGPASMLSPLVLQALDTVPDARAKTAADLACGTGLVVPALAARVGRVLGIDVSAALLARARSACRATHVSYHRAELADLSAFRGSLDVAVALDALRATDGERLDRVFDGIRAVLRAGGILIGIFPSAEALDATSAAGRPHFYALDLGHRLRQAGFGRPRLARVAHPRRVPDAAGAAPLWHWLVRTEVV